MYTVVMSYPITESMLLYGQTPSPKITKFTSIEEGASSNTTLLTIHTHTGTHIDFPKHFISEGRNLSDYQAGDFIFPRPIVLGIPKGPGELIGAEDLEPFSDKLAGADLLLIRTGFYQYREQDLYKIHNPGIHSAGIRYIRTNYKNIRAVGADIISVSSYQHREDGRLAHREAFRNDSGFGEPLLLIEDLDLSADLSGLKRVLVFPLLITGVEAAPCTAIGELE